jgi:hypothetical protein
MNKTLLSISAVATLVIGATAMTAQAAPTVGSALQGNASMIQKAHGDGYGGWDGDYRGRSHRRWDDGGWHRRSWWWRRHHHRGHHEWRGDRGHGHGDRGGDHREHRRGDWR